MKRVFQGILLAVVIAAAVFTWRYFFPGPETQIRRKMAQLEELASFSGTEGNLELLGTARKLGEMFADDARVQLDVQGGPKRSLQGRENIIEAALGALHMSGGMTVEFLDITVTLDANRREATVEATGEAVPKGTDDLWIQDLRFRFIQTDEGWLILSVETVRTLTQVPARRMAAWGVPRRA